MDNQQQEQTQPTKFQQFIFLQQKAKHSRAEHNQQSVLRSPTKIYCNDFVNSTFGQNVNAANMNVVHKEEERLRRRQEDEQELCELYEAAAVAAQRIMLDNNNRQRKSPVNQCVSSNVNNDNNNNLCKINNRSISAAVKQIPILATRARSRNDAAISDLLSSIPEIEHNFDVHSRIGHGTFSTVLLATLKKERRLPDAQRRKFAIKHHIPTSHPERIMKELQCMTKMGGTDNVIGINCCIRCDASVAFVMPYMSHDRFHEFFTIMPPNEVQVYMKNLLIALRHVHKFAIIHRDVKPSNFLYNRRLGKFLLVDFGLAQHVPNSSVLSGQDATQHQQSAKEDQQMAGQKRTRDLDDVSNGNQAGNCKRLRMNVDWTNAAPVSSATAATSGSNKMPLKQINEIKYKSVNVPDCLDMSNQHQQGQIQEGISPVTHTVVEASTPCFSASATTAAVGATGSNNKYSTNRVGGSNNNNKCFCYGQPNVCNICLVKKEVHASRAGTPGYRPPEVLLKYPDQTTAVDMWAVGVIFLSILSSVYPFFKAPNDYVALSEIVTIFGDKKIRKTANVLERLLTLSQRGQPLDLRKVCVRFRNRIFSSPEMFKRYAKADGVCVVCKNCDQYFFNCLCQESLYEEMESIEPHDIFPPSAYDLLERLLEVNPHKRITAEEALNHPFLADIHIDNNDDAHKTDNSGIAKSTCCYNGISKTGVETKIATVAPLKRIGPLLNDHLNLHLNPKT